MVQFGQVAIRHRRPISLRFRSLALRWLFGIGDLPPQRTVGEFQAEVSRNYGWNFAVSVMDVSFFNFGASFASSATVLPLFVSKLTPDPFALGIVAMLAQGGWYLPQLLTANLTERLVRRKPAVVNFGFFAERIPFCLLVAAAILAPWSQSLALFVTLGAFAWHTLGAGIIAPAWQDLVARCFPVESRGRFLGISSFLGAGAGAIGAGVSAWILGAMPFPASFATVFGIAAAGICASWVFLALVREPVRAVIPTRRSHADYLGGLREILRGDRNFRWFLVGRVLMAASAMGFGFLAVGAVQRWQLADAEIGFFTAALLVGQAGGNLIFGFVADRIGHLAPLRVGAACSTVAYGLALMAPGPQWYLLVFGAMGLSIGAVSVSGLLVVMEFAPADRRPTYVGLTNSLIGLAAGVSPVLGALAVGTAYWILYAGSLVAALGALLVFVVSVAEPRYSPRPISVQ